MAGRAAGRTHRTRLLFTVAGALAAGAAPLAAHTGAPPRPDTLLAVWQPDPLVLVTAGALLLLYARGVHVLWRRAGPGRGVTRAAAGAFTAGMLVLLTALATPLDTLGSALFAAHMTQHELLMVVAAPLLALSQANVALLHALPLPWRRVAGRVSTRAGRTRAWNTLVHPLGALALHVTALFAWHTPALYGRSLASGAVHALQHAAFFGTAVLFWWALARAVRRGPAGYGLGALALFGAAAAGSVLGALLTFAPTAWYAAYQATAPAWGFTALADQQLGGLIMWVPGGLVYVGAVLVLVAGGLGRLERRATRRRHASVALTHEG